LEKIQNGEDICHICKDGAEVDFWFFGYKSG
jgi:hypothetical protein